MLNKIKSELLNFGLKFISVDEKIVRMILETTPSKVNEIIILPAVKIVMKKLVNKLQNKVVHGRVYNGTLNGIRVSIIRSQIGCPNVAMTVECLKRTKAKLIVRLDVCGGIHDLADNITIGDLIVPKTAYCDDGTSPQYIRANPMLMNQLESIQNPLSTIQNITTGNQTIYIAKPDELLKDLLFNEAYTLEPKLTKEIDLLTTDALFCESYDFISALKKINIQAIDMESSILFLLGKLYNIKVASILSVSDLPTHPQYDLLTTNELHPNMEIGIDKSIKILIRSLPKINHSIF